MRRRLCYTSAAAVALLVHAAAALAQQPIGPERIVVPLSRPGSPASVEVSLISGGVSVEAYDGKEVIVEARTRAGDGETRRRTPKDLDKVSEEDAEEVAEGATRSRSRSSSSSRSDTTGMRRIPNDSAGLTVEEDGNHVEINAESWRQTIDIHLLVPASTRLHLSCVNSGDIVVKGVEGEMELSNVNGRIDVEGAAAAVVADSVNGRLRVTFQRLDGDKPMAFNTLNGSVELTLPASAKAEVQLRSDNGEIYSDFEVALNRDPVKVEQERRDGKFRVVVEKGVRGTIGGGGRQIRITTFNGDILLRRPK